MTVEDSPGGLIQDQQHYLEVMERDFQSGSEISAIMSTIVQESNRMLACNERLIEGQKRLEIITMGLSEQLCSLERRLEMVMQESAECFNYMDETILLMEKKFPASNSLQAQPQMPAPTGEIVDSASASAEGSDVHEMEIEPCAEPVRPEVEIPAIESVLEEVSGSLPKGGSQTEFLPRKPEKCEIFEQRGNETVNLGPHNIEIINRNKELFVVLRFSENEVFEYPLKTKDMMIRYDADETNRTYCFTVNDAAEFFGAEFESAEIAQQFQVYFSECVERISSSLH